MTQKIRAMVDGGKATPGPPLGPALGPLGVPIVKVVAAVNEKTKSFIGMKVPVTITVEKDRSWDISVGTPPTSALILGELKIAKGSGSARTAKAGNITVAQATKIASMKLDDLGGRTKRDAVKQVVGSCVSMGITVENRDPRDIQLEIDEGKWDAAIGS